MFSVLRRNMVATIMAAAVGVVLIGASVQAQQVPPPREALDKFENVRILNVETRTRADGMVVADVTFAPPGTTGQETSAIAEGGHIQNAIDNKGKIVKEIFTTKPDGPREVRAINPVPAPNPSAGG